MGKTLFEKIWAEHRVAALNEATDLIYIDRVLLHERTGSIALRGLDSAGRTVRRPEQAFVCMDHIVDTFQGRSDQTTMPGGKAFIQETRASARKAGIHIFDIGDANQGIVHVVAPEQGITLPGLTIVCPDSHTCTQGGLGALAWGIGSTEAEHALATQTLAVKRPRLMRVQFYGDLAFGVTAKDMMLHLIACYGSAGGANAIIEFAGSTVSSLSVEARMTLCNMAVEFAAWSAICAPDEKVRVFLKNRPYAPADDRWEEAIDDWRQLASDHDAVFETDISIDAATIAPMVTWGTSPQQAIAVDGRIPELALEDDIRQQSAKRALNYMGLDDGASLMGIPIDAAFIGSCTNSRLSDLRAAATILKGRHVASGVRAICVPGSMQVKAAAEAEGIDQVFLKAGFEWRLSGCSMCFFAGGEHFGTKERVVTSTNRNFENRQGPGTRSHLASPETVAASAIAGAIADVRQLAH